MKELFGELESVLAPEPVNFNSYPPSRNTKGVPDVGSVQEHMEDTGSVQEHIEDTGSVEEYENMKNYRTNFTFLW